MSKRQTFITGVKVDLVVINKEDASLLASWMNDSEVNQYLSRGSVPETEESEERFIESTISKDKLVLGIWHKEDQKLIGTTGWHNIDQLHQSAVFGISIGDKDYWSKGIGTEVLELMTTYAFQTRNLRTVRLSVLSNNPRGKKCYEKCGFVTVGAWPKSVFKSGQWFDEELMQLNNPLYS